MFISSPQDKIMKKIVSVITAFFMTINVAKASCNKDGGDYPDCVDLFANLPKGHIVPPGTYSSGGTFILKNAGCVSRNTKFRFHSAFYGDDFEHVKALSPTTNAKQLQMFEQYPRLQKYLLSSGAFEQVLPLTVIDGEMVHLLTGLPYCEI